MQFILKYISHLRNISRRITIYVVSVNHRVTRFTIHDKYPTREPTMAFDNNRDQIVNRERANSRRSETGETGCECRIRKLEIVLIAALQLCRLSISTAINFTPIHFV